MLSFVFEETPEKRQLALLSALIKALSWHCDYLIVTGNAVITFDGYGAVFVPSRYAQWSCTTPTMLFILSKISDFTPGQAFFAMLCDWIMIVSGYVAAVYPPGIISFLALIVSFVTFYIVLSNLSLMINSAMAETKSPQARWSLQFTLWSSLVIWNIFPVAWLVGRMGASRGYSTLGALGVTLDLMSNFVSFTSSSLLSDLLSPSWYLLLSLFLILTLPILFSFSFSSQRYFSHLASSTTTLSPSSRDALRPSWSRSTRSAS